MGAIVESTDVGVERREYEVAGWGVGELWTSDCVVVAHDFDFGVLSGQGRDLHLGTKATLRDASPDPALVGAAVLDGRPNPPLARVHGGNGRAALADTDTATEIACDAVERVRAFLGGEDGELEDMPIDLDWCTDFQRDVLTALRGVPRGDVVTYGELAALAGRPGAARAVGTICATNRYAFFVPCHRVVGAGGIGGYGSAGVEVKRRLLGLEDVSL
jgi:methylated-DNA-[protein]-cysteine S-methyltransferase